MRLGMPRLGRAFDNAVRRSIPGVAAQNPPTQADDTEARDKKGEAHEEPRADPLAREIHRRQCTGAGSAAISASSSPDSRRSRSGMKLRTGGTRSKL